MCLGMLTFCSRVPLKMKNGTAVISSAEIFMSCQVAVANRWIGIGVIPSTFIGFDDPPIFMPELVEPGTVVPGVTVVTELLAELPQPVRATPATPATTSDHAR